MSVNAHRTYSNDVVISLQLFGGAVVPFITPGTILSQGQVSCALDPSAINFPGVVTIRIGNDQTDLSETSVVIGRYDSACSQCSSENITLSDSEDGVCLSLNVSPLTS